MKKLLVAMFLISLAFFVSCDDEFYPWGFPFGTTMGIDCPIPVPTPAPDGQDVMPADDQDQDGDGEDDGVPAGEDGCLETQFAICHIPRGNPDNYFTICVGSEAAVEAHLAHGDIEGYCEDIEFE